MEAPAHMTTRNRLSGALLLWIGIASACTMEREDATLREPVGTAAYDTAWFDPLRRDRVLSSNGADRSDPHDEAFVLEQRLRQDPMDTLAIVELARLLESSQQAEQAARYYRRLVTINRASRQGWIGLASVYETLENWNAAEEAITAMLAFAPGDTEAMYLLGMVHANRGDLAAARTWWRRVERQATDPQLAERAAQSLRRMSGSRS